MTLPLAAPRHIFCLAIALSFFIVSHLSPTKAVASDDWELWTELRWKKPLFDRLLIQGVSTVRFRKDMQDFYRHFDELGLTVKMFPWLRMESAYHWNYSQQPRTRSAVYEHRPYIGAIPQLSIGKLQLENRNRIEHRRINGTIDWRYRNRLKAVLSLGKNKWWSAKTFISNELFYGFEAGKISRDRFSCGLEKSFNRLLSGELFYVMEFNRTERNWQRFHALGLAVTLNF